MHSLAKQINWNDALQQGWGEYQIYEYEYRYEYL